LKNADAAYKTTSSLLKIARNHFTKYGYFAVSLEKIATEGNVTRGAVYHHFKNKQGLFTAVLESVQKDVAAQILIEAMKSEDPWQQLILGFAGFVNGANAKKNRRILLVDAPAVLGWDAWRKADKENSMSVLQKHIDDLKAQNYLRDDVDTKLMTYSLSGAVNEIALHCTQRKVIGEDDRIIKTISQLVSGFKK
jgi:AcrR family transcriptional regulator